MADEFYASTPEPASAAAVRARLAAFVAAHSSSRLVCVTSGGTTVPLEKNTVRFIDNFSTGNRGAASAELFLRAGYAVVFLHRQGSAFPFARRALGKSAEALLEAGDDAAAALARAAAEYREHRAQLLAVPFVSVSDYLFLLREAAQALAPAGARALLYLAAAVSDFYLPESAMAEHKIQSGGGLALELSGVPKVLGAVKAEWAPAALVVSFKLETNEHVLLAKAAGALRKYAVDLVVANRLATYKRHVTLVMRSSRAVPPSAPAVRGDEVAPVAVEGVDCMEIALPDGQEGGDIEELLVSRLAELHADHLRAHIRAVALHQSP